MDVGKLEQAILAAPDDPEGYLVYGDWLENKGDPRGELIAVQAKLAIEPSDALFTREHELIAANERAWLGELLWVQRSADRLVCDWHYGFLRSVTMFLTSKDLFEDLAACPSAKFLQRIVVDERAAFFAETHPPDAGVFGPHVEIVIRGEVDPPLMTPETRREATAAMEAVLEEDSAVLRADPLPTPWSLASSLLAKPEYVAYLVEQLASTDARATWAKNALFFLGPKAASAAHALRTHECWLELFLVAPDLARSLGVHRRFVVREGVSHVLFGQDPRLCAKNLADALMSDDRDLLCWALDGNGYSDRSFLERLTRERPRLVSVPRLRALLAHADSRVRSHACSRLVEIRAPESADDVIDVILEGRAKPRPLYAMWLGSHPRSDALLSLTTDPREIFHLKRRRRCAGLSRDLEELDDPENNALYTLARGDQLFLDGRLDDPTLSDAGALGSYARTLLNDPRCGPAAFRIAWIERGFGAFMSKPRVAWLRGLGVSEDALAMLERPPPQVVPGFGYGASILEPNPIKAAAALAAGLPSLAAWYLPKDSAEVAAARAAAKLQLPGLC